ncbi:Eco57I restriction-modification methylase domain-containing protein [Microbacterium gorillae]|uniref:Eco57I restriction-modification methylase domain-containing protein n=1 Tax=Microbacterium gorillae TaxID=1231063 RepID=UPI003D97560F
MYSVENLDELAQLCFALGAASVGTLDKSERALMIASPTRLPSQQVEIVRQAILKGEDPLGEAYISLRSPQERRPLGQTYTPRAVVEAMISWAEDQGVPSRIVDPGVGSGRYLLAAARAFPEAELVGADIDPIATLMLRAALAVTKLGSRARVILGDYRSMSLPDIDGRTLFIGNPPYVRHHQIDPAWKAWLLATAKKHGFKASALAGLHVHFFLATAEHGRPGDLGAFITSAEWLDVNYGSLVRELLLDGLGGQALHILDPSAAPFADATTTGAITCFSIGGKPESIRVRQVGEVADLGRLNQGHAISRQRLAEANRWSVLTRVTPKLREGYVELGELCRVHRGTVTGANKVWVHRDGGIDLPDRVLFASVTKARELFGAGDRLRAFDGLKRVIDLPVDLGDFDPDERRQIDRFLRVAESQNVQDGYVAANRKAWWSVGLRAPAPVLATYMARRPPAFVRNDVGARHINIAHGLYPREEMSALTLDNLAAHLRSAVTLSQGRTYAGGLTKFEPREMERLPVPSLESLIEGDVHAPGAAAPLE